MMDYRTGRRWIELKIDQPAAYRGWMRLYVDRISGVSSEGSELSTIWWHNTPAMNDQDLVELKARIRASDVLAMMRRA
jgi:hypothetical protein